MADGKSGNLWAFHSLYDKNLYTRMSPSLQRVYDSWVRSDASTRTSAAFTKLGKGYRPSMGLLSWLCGATKHLTDDELVEAVDTRWMEDNYRVAADELYFYRGWTKEDAQTVRERVQAAKFETYQEYQKKVTEMGLPIARVRPDLEEIIRLGQERSGRNSADDLIRKGMAYNGDSLWNSFKNSYPEVVRRPYASAAIAIGIATLLYTLVSSVFGDPNPTHSNEVKTESTRDFVN